MQTTLDSWEGQLQTQPLSPERDFSATRASIAPVQAGHEIQQQPQVSESRTSEAVVEKESGSATVRSGCPQLQQPLQQQSPQCQLQSRSESPLRNGYNPFKGANSKKKTYKNLFLLLCEYNNLLLASQKAKKRKPKRPYVQEFEKNRKANLIKLQWRLLTGTYVPDPLKAFIVRDPKTRKISASAYPDRIVHHAICNLLEPIFERRFIFDSYANRKGKGTKAALERFDKFFRKNENGYALKADIYHYFDSVDQKILLQIIGKRIKDEQIMQLIEIILKNHKTEYVGKGMPLGNLTSQIFANIYLAELDNFVKHELQAKYYLRYVDDFILLSQDKKQLESWQERIKEFLNEKLHLQLHPNKTKIIPINGGVSLVGFRVFRHHKLPKKSNQRRIWKRIARFKQRLAEGKTTKEHIRSSMAGWNGYARMGNTFKLRNKIKEQIASIC